MSKNNGQFGGFQIQPPNSSPRWRLNDEDLTKLAKSFALAMGGFALVYLGSVVLPGLSFSSVWGPLLGALGPVIVNFGRKLLSGSS